MNKEFKILGATILAFSIIGGVLLFFNSSKKEDISAQTPIEIEATNLIRPHNQRFGPQDAPVTLVEFYDPECEACGAFHPVLKKILQEFDGKIQFVVRYATFHGNSALAVKASEAAGKQGKFWEFHDLIFDKQEQWSHQETPQTELMLKYARNLKLDIKKFNDDLKSPEAQKIIETDIEDGKALGVHGTPTIFVNGKKLEELDPKILVMRIRNELGQNLYRPEENAL